MGIQVRPMTAEEFAALEADGKTVVYAETLNEVPPGPEWQSAGRRVTPDESVFVWWRIALIDEVLREIDDE